MFEGYKWRCTVDYTEERFDRFAEDDCEYETCSVCGKKIDLCDEDEYYYDEKTEQYYCLVCVPSE